MAYDINKIIIGTQSYATGPRLMIKSFPKNNFVSVAIIYGLLFIVFNATVYPLILFWLESPEYGHGILLAGICGYLLWSRREIINHSTTTLRPLGVIALALSLLLFVIGFMGDISILKHYSLVMALASIPASLGGLKLLKVFSFPLLLLLFAIPFHPAINNILTSELQLISSEIGVWFIRLMGMAALQDGNVIDMGNFVLLVEEACSGLRYLLPLASLSLLAAYYFRGNLILKGLIFLSVVPITVLMNSLRIAITGLIIKYYGSEAAEGFLHDFEGFVVFLAACGLLLCVLAMLSLILRQSLSVEKNFSFEYPTTAIAAQSPPPNPRSFWTLIIVVFILGGVANIIALTRSEVIPNREKFEQFPLAINGLDLYPDTLAEKFLDILKPDDYFIGDFLSSDQDPINLYMAYYESQQEGSLIHSPKACIPAGGWEIVSMETVDLSPTGLTGEANRAIIKKGDEELLTYFWINQQGINFADESSSYLSLIKRSAIYSRTDATLVRVIIPAPNNQLVLAEARLQDFVRSLAPVLPRFLPL